MGRSNGCEANRKRADAQKRAEKFAKDGKSQNDVNAQAMSIICQKCFQTFMCTQRKMAETHAADKHPKCTFIECFPDIDTATAGATTGGDKRQTDNPNNKKKEKKK